MPEIIDHIPQTAEQYSFIQSPEAAQSQEVEFNFLERVRLGGNELAICGVVDLNPGTTPDEDYQTERLVILDVGFKDTKDGKYGPYDIDGTGTKRTFDKPYVILKLGKNGDGVVDPSQTRYIEVGDDEELTIGRSHPSAEALGIEDNLGVSRNHAKISFIGKNGSIKVSDLNSSNGTQAKSAQEILGSTSSEFGYTISVGDFVHAAGKSKHYESADQNEGWGYGVYAGRPIIARDTPINGGVYPVGGRHGEAIVIDDEKYPEDLVNVVDRLLEKFGTKQESATAIGGLRAALLRRHGIEDISSQSETEILRDVFGEVSKALRYDIEATDALAKDSQKIALNMYVQEGVGVCRTQAVFAAYLTEKLISAGVLSGRVSIDRNQNRTVDGVGGHAWMRYTDEKGEVFIIDPAQQYVGALRDTTDRNWDYRRTEDMIKQLAL